MTPERFASNAACGIECREQAITEQLNVSLLYKACLAEMLLRLEHLHRDALAGHMGIVKNGLNPVHGLAVECERLALLPPDEPIRQPIGADYSIDARVARGAALRELLKGEGPVPEGDHYVTFKPMSWFVEHSLECRRSGRMAAGCAFQTAIETLGEPDADVLGRWHIDSIDSEGLPKLTRAPLEVTS